MTDITNLVKNLRHWANMASLTSEQVSCLSVPQLETIANELDSAHQLIAELESFRTAYMEWIDKTDWVRDDRRFDVVKPLGKHLADVLREYIEHLESRLNELKESHAQVIQSRDHYKRMTEEGLKQLAESRTVKLPKRSVGEVMHMSGFSHDYAEGWCSGNDNAIHEMRAAGIKVEGE